MEIKAMKQMAGRTYILSDSGEIYQSEDQINWSKVNDPDVISLFESTPPVPAAAQSTPEV